MTDAGKELAQKLAEVAKPVARKKVTKVAQPKKSTSNLKVSWLVARLRNALHKARPALKEEKNLKEVSTLSEMKATLSLPREEWEALLESFFNLGGKLEG